MRGTRRYIHTIYRHISQQLWLVKISFKALLNKFNYLISLICYGMLRILIEIELKLTISDQ